MSDAELFIRCDCHSPEHMLIFDVWHWDTERPQNSELSVHYGLDPCMSIWRRIRYAAQFVLTGKTGKWWWADTIIKDADTARLRDYLTAYLESSLNAASAMSTGTAKTPQAVEGQSPASATRQGDAQPSQPSHTPSGDK